MPIIFNTTFMKNKVITLLHFFVLAITVASAQVLPPSVKKVDDIPKSYTSFVQKFYEEVKNNRSCYDRLGRMCDKFGHRLSGSESLEGAIDWIVKEMKNDGFDTVYTEKVMVPHWIRGKESCSMILPRKNDMTILGLGGTVATPEFGIEAEIFVAKDFTHLRANSDKVKGKIVLFNVPFTKYGETVAYRVTGAVEAARLGAVAMLVRSVGPESMNTPHTGMLRYNDSINKIPAAAVTLEDAELLSRLTLSGEKVIVNLKLEGKYAPDAESRNIIAEIRGREKPEEVVVFGGHIDSWDVGQGAMDDGGGCFVAWDVLKAVKKMNIQPRRTMRCVFWTNEENGLRGGNQYAINRAQNISKHVLAIESDAGTFKPTGFALSGSNEAKSTMKTILSTLAPYGIKNIIDGEAGADVSPLTSKGVAGAGLLVDDTRYFWYHHTDADTMDKLKPEELAECIFSMGVLATIVADIPFDLPAERK